MEQRFVYKERTHLIFTSYAWLCKRRFYNLMQRFRAYKKGEF